MRSELHTLAIERGVTHGAGSRCQLCGESPFDSAGHAAKVLGKGFSDYQWMSDLGTDQICLGCQALLKGRPGDDPPPLRMWSFVLDDAGLRLVRPKDLWPLLASPPTGRFLISWATSGKIHHWIRCRWSSAELLRIGHDRETIELDHAGDGPLLEVVPKLLYSPTGTGPILSRRSIASGSYHPKSLEKFGITRWRDLEAIVARWRPSLLLDLVCASAPMTTDREEVEQVLDPVDIQAGELLANIAESSELRRGDGKLFWGGFFQHRVNRFRRLPLADFVSRLMGACRCSPNGGGSRTAAVWLASIDDANMEKVANAIRDRSDLLVTLAYDALRKRKESRKVERP